MWYECILVISSSSPKGKLLRSSWHLFCLAFAQCGMRGSTKCALWYQLVHMFVIGLFWLIYSGDSKSGPSVVKHHRENVEHLVGNISTTVLSTSTSVNTPSDITDEDGVIKRRIDGQASLQGAFIALCFGVAITLFLVIFAFCRFCRGCSGSRKGRRLNVDGETDYLVNGMYLWYGVRWRHQLCALEKFWTHHLLNSWLFSCLVMQILYDFIEQY